MTAEALVDLAALRGNVRALAKLVAPSEVMLAVKADAYGHGMLQIAQAGLDAGATALAVLEVPAALRLRQAGFEVPLFAWLHGVETDFRAAVDEGVELGVSAVWQLDAIADAASDRTAVVHLKLDTGLHRNGATPEEWPALVDRAVELRRAGVLELRGAWSHLADAGEDADRDALARFHEGVAEARRRGADFEVLHLAASSAGIYLPEARFDYVRFGIAAYGISPFDDRSGADLGLTPVMTLRSSVSRVTDAGAEVAAGFGDGVLVKGAGTAEVLVAGERRRVLRVDVDTMLVEGGASDGDEVLIFGSGASGEPTAEDWARWAGTIGDEVVTHVAPRVARLYPA